MSDIKELVELINRFRDERDWRQFHNAKDLAISISIEAAELLEDFQWTSAEQALEDHKEHVEEEIADVLIYTLMLCSDLELDVKEIVKNKMKKNELKYPVSS
ncbi:nucleotide pyrophosphohydrolase [Piscibacillus sp. B03]|uniref:nucleotide pyrophosphohydrolase n=1 Tax=Piscibacillus sp. B03 TaxID=3457430 RepID=UPI003FCC51D9